MALFLLFLAVPLIEIALFIQIGGVIGLGWTLLTVVVTAIAGTALVRTQGLRSLAEIRGSMDRLRDPTEPLAHGAMILFSGALLLTPGFFTDAIGFSLLIPQVRMAVFRYAASRMTIHTVSATRTRRAEMHPGVGPIETEYEDITDRPQGAPRPGGDAPSGWTKH